ncbi:mitochondrial ABC1 kinase-like protein, human ADCK5 ortholog, unknown role, possible chaperone for ubiquinone biosynthesis [Schizosaccharomyces pombe]|uniref:ABC1 family protein C10F6.14c n=1 Tax=Schizosaccharomyces pombe (strain 972 / ATCC 24843) TaxID=284812 RepID=YF9E_SCHPO|nr:putative ABC1 kinase family protein [Schizosaccharomyces pombe]O42653.1 RecName: Full=ABC1 family protein C10F6.14c [Schizosaccharomyces pombe 972h-]CAA15727.1 ABC1 kinase family protein (predicted) [Schizosaccharomyces pombe]|eukprot:NP_593265.1 putative ABC1 kinase family protein [Schizosaccharomyces pombe]
MLTSWRTISLLQKTTSRFIKRSKTYADVRYNSQALQNHGVPGNKRKWMKRFVFVGAAGIGVYAWDRVYNAHALTRSIRTVYTASIIAADYKLNFSEKKADKIDALHQRVAQRLFKTIYKNGGLYIKMGQIIAMQSNNLPEAYGKAFQGMFDNAPQVEWEELQDIFKEQYGRPVEEVFASIEKRAAASASIAQVHRAVLPSGEKVAVKIQKPDVAKQMSWDLLVYKYMMYVYDKWIFHIPLYFTVDYVSERLRSEVDFTTEANNSEHAREGVEETDYLRDKIYIPKVYKEISGKRVMVTEWADGIPLYDQTALSEAGMSKKEILTNLFRFLAFQMFHSKQVHCDPHPGNILVRKNQAGLCQTVILDHGLYVFESEKFRKEFALLFTAAYSLDKKSILQVMDAWGIGQPELFANRMLNIPMDEEQPHTGEKIISKKEAFQQQLAERKKFIGFLQDCTRLPKELLMLGRCLMLIQKNNQNFGYPVNSIAVMAKVADKYTTDKPSPTWYQRLLSPIFWVFQHLFYPGNFRLPELTNDKK